MTTLNNLKMTNDHNRTKKAMRKEWWETKCNCCLFKVHKWF